MAPARAKAKVVQAPAGPSAVVLLGAQRFDPTLGEAVASLGVEGPIATVTAGWQERESDDEDLVEHLAGRAINLRLHARGEEVFEQDAELRAAHREKQDALRHRQEFYRIRLEHELAADHVIRQRKAPAGIAAEQSEESLATIRELDLRHLATCARLHAEFETRWSVSQRPAVIRHREEVAAIVARCGAIAIAGGHVATLVNRLAMFGLGDLARGRVVFAWSGGAMAISERVVLFHDDPPQGPGASELLDAGLGLLPGVVALPQPEQRLQLERRERVQGLVRRFAPARCLALPARSWASFRGGKLAANHGVVLLAADGGHGPLLLGSANPPNPPEQP